MGVQGLLQELKHKVKTINIASFAGKKVGVDAYAWLHRGAYGCATELCTGLGSDKYIEFCMYRIRMMRAHDVEPVVVFDGASHPLKRHTNSARSSQRKTALSQGIKLQQEGNLEAASKLYQKAVQVTADMAYKLIVALKSERMNGKPMPVAFIVAPYEADAQLAYQSLLYKRTGGKCGVAAIVTEDSDLLAYGASPILYKLDQAGDCNALSLYEIIHESGHEEIGGGHSGNLASMSYETQPTVSENLEDNSSSNTLQLGNFTLEVFQLMCVLSGCDFLNIKNFGIKSAYKLCRKYRNIDRIIRMICSALSKSAQAELKRHALAGVNPLSTLMKDIYFSYYAIRHSRVYDEQSKALVSLRPCDDLKTTISDLLKRLQPNLDLGGPRVTNQIVQDIAEGQINPHSGSSYTIANAPTVAVDLGSKRTFPPEAFRCEDSQDLDVVKSDDSFDRECDVSSIRLDSIEALESTSRQLGVIDTDLVVNETQTASDSFPAVDDECSQGMMTQSTQIAESGRCDQGIEYANSIGNDSDMCSQSKAGSVGGRPESLRPVSAPINELKTKRTDVHKPVNVFGNASSMQKKRGIFDDIINLELPRNQKKRLRSCKEQARSATKTNPLFQAKHNMGKAKNSRLKQTSIISSTLQRLWRTRA